MAKKLLMALVAVVAVAGGIAALSAYEAHVINVTAHIENALTVDTTPIEFGTVFPQEYFTNKTFKIALSESFMGAGTQDDVHYVIAQKPKPKDANGTITFCKEPHVSEEGITISTGEYCRDYVNTPVYKWEENEKECTRTEKVYNDFCYLSLCPFLSKTSPDTNDTSEPSYYFPATTGAAAYCEAPATTAAGYLSKHGQDIDDVWTVDLKVPPVAGYVGQDWPASCKDYVVAKDGQDYGCDLWVEVTGISRPVCGNGVVEEGETCETNADCTGNSIVGPVNGSCNRPGTPLECQCVYPVQIGD